MMGTELLNLYDHYQVFENHIHLISFPHTYHSRTDVSSSGPCQWLTRCVETIRMKCPACNGFQFEQQMVGNLKILSVTSQLASDELIALMVYAKRQLMACRFNGLLFVVACANNEGRFPQLSHDLRVPFRSLPRRGVRSVGLLLGQFLIILRLNGNQISQCSLVANNNSQNQQYSSIKHALFNIT